MFNGIYTEIQDALNGIGELPRVVGTNGDDVLISDSDELTLVQGLGGDDFIIGGPGNNILDGNTGDDTIFGGTGADLIRGGVGEDSLYGAGGNDRIVATLDDAMVAGGRGFDVAYIKNDLVDSDETTFDFVTQGRDIEAVVGYGTEDVSANVSLSNIMWQSQDDGDELTPDTDNTFVAVGLVELSLQSVHKFTDDDGDLVFSSVDVTGAEEDAYIEMLGLSFLPDGRIDLYAYTFGEGDAQVTIVTDLAAEDITVGGDSLADLDMGIPQ